MNIIQNIGGAVNMRLRSVLQVVIIFSSLLTGAFVNAQSSQTLYFMDRLPQSSLLNPSHQHLHNFHLGLPALSSISLNARNNFLSLSDVIFEHPDSSIDSLISFLHPDADIDDFISNFRDRNFIEPSLHLNLLSFGFRAGKSFVSFNISERANGRMSVPGDLFKLALKGNEQFVGRTADFSAIGLDFSYYREYALGVSYIYDDKLTVGARGKLLYGKANISFSDSNISLYTDPGSYNMELNTRIKMNLSMPVTITRDADGDIDGITAHFDDSGYDPLDFVLNTGNSGFAIDLGATYKLFEPVTLFASITDLGYISWGQDVYNISLQGSYEFRGLDLTSEFDDDESTDFGDDFLKELENSFDITSTENSYRKWMPARIYLGGTYELHRLLSFGFLSRSEIYQGQVNQAVTFSANTNFGRWISLSASYSAMNNTYNNLGLGVSLRAAGLQFYLVSDNINTVLAPQNSRSANIWFGVNFVFGRPR